MRQENTSTNLTENSLSLRKSENPCALRLTLRSNDFRPILVPWRKLQEFRREWLWKHPVCFSKQYSHFYLFIYMGFCKKLLEAEF